MWWYTVDRLLEDKKAGVTDQERAELVADLEKHRDGSNTGIRNSTRMKPRMPPSA